MTKVIDRDSVKHLQYAKLAKPKRFFGNLSRILGLIRNPKARNKTFALVRSRAGRRLLWNYIVTALISPTSDSGNLFDGVSWEFPTITRPEGSIEISVVITIFNQESEILEAFTSVLSQTFSSWELIIWNDGSTNPNTLQYLEAIRTVAEEQGFGDTRIRVFHDTNRGVVRARNGAADYANGRYLAFLDPDDKFHPTYLEKAYITLEGLPGVSIASPDVRLIDHPEPRWNSTPLAWPDIKMFNHLPVCSVMELVSFRGIGGFRNEMDLGWEDWDLWVRFASTGIKSARIPEPLFQYTHSEHSGRDATSGRPNELQLRQNINNVKRHASNHKDRPMPCANLGPVFDTFPPRNIPQTGQTVIFFIPWILKAGGADRFLKELARGLSNYDTNLVFILTEINIPQGSEDDIQDFMWNHNYFYRLPSFLHPDNYDDFVRSIINGMTDPILICMGSAYFYGFLQRNFSDLRSDGKIIDILFNDVGHADAHSSVSHCFSDVVLAYSGLEGSLTAKQILRGRSVVIPVGIGHSNSGPRERKQVGNRPKLGWIGRFSSEKRPEWFVNLARTHGDKADFHMVGTGPLLSDIELRSGKNKSLIIENYVENSGEFYNQLDLLVITSEIEGIPLVLMEAMDHGIPVLSTKVGGIPDLIQHGVNGYLTDAYHYSEMETALGMLLNMDDLLQELQLNSSELRLGQDFYLDAMIRKYVDLLGLNK